LWVDVHQIYVPKFEPGLTSRTCDIRWQSSKVAKSAIVKMYLLRYRYWLGNQAEYALIYILTKPFFDFGPQFSIRCLQSWL